MLLGIRNVSHKHTVVKTILGIFYTNTLVIYVRKLNQSYLDELGIHFMPGWKDPWGER